MSNSPTDINRAEYWSRAYREDRARWDMGTPAPAFEDVLRMPQQMPTGRRTFAPGSMFVPGCGYGRDALLFAENGFDVTAVDIAPEPLRRLEEEVRRKKLDATVLQRDMFDLSPQYDGAFDYILEYVTMCSLEPRRQPEYIALLHRLLKPDGWVIGMIFPMDGRPGGPPFSVDMDELNAMLEGKFAVLDERFHPASITPRAGKEKFIVWEKLP